MWNDSVVERDYTTGVYKLYGDLQFLATETSRSLSSTNSLTFTVPFINGYIPFHDCHVFDQND
jgi:hypothetical protein